MENKTKERPVFVAWINTDLTEGRGAQIPLYISENKSTAIRLGKGQDVQGCDATVTPATLYSIDGHWYGPVRLAQPTKEDEINEAIRLKRDAAVERAKAAGLSAEDIVALGG